MTECERIIEQGILPKSFFEEDTICDYFVTKEQKKIWAVEIDLLVKFDEICRKHGLRYSLIFGSLLGAIRHHGFIPWDDDIDVVMPRSDYEKMRLFREDFKDPYFLQFPCDDNGYYISFAKLRNSNTTGLSLPLRYETFNQGMFIDIFPLDNYVYGDIDEETKKIRFLMSECSCLMKRRNPFLEKKEMERRSLFPIVRNGDVIMREMEDILRKYENVKTDKCIIWSFQVYGHEKVTFDKSWFEDLIEVNFYGYNVFIPRNYKEVLSVTYGDYLKYPPMEARCTVHPSSVFDPDTPYIESLSKFRDKDRAYNPSNQI